jgi:hypothetical protein
VSGVLWVLFAVVLGCLAVYRLSDLKAMQPRWAAGLLVAGAGIAVGIGLTSVLFFVSRQALPGVPGLPMWIEIAGLVWVCYEVFRTRQAAAGSAAMPPFPYYLPLAAALIVALVMVTSIMNIAWDSIPEGNWDAWSIWNLRARFLAAGGDLAPRAWSPMIGSTHPEYPLLTSAFVARCWAYGRTVLNADANAVPIAVSYLFFLAVLALATGGVAVLRSRSLGLLLGLSILASPLVLMEVPAQYADVPLACYFMGALLFWLLDRPVLAGAFAGFAAWTKDEGLLFLAVFLLGSAIFKRGQVPRLIAGVLPAGVLTLVFKAALATGTSSLMSSSAPGLLHRLADAGRYWQVTGAFAGAFLGMMVDWYHPVLPVLILAVALRFDRRYQRDALFTGGICVLMLLGYFGIYIITSNDLTWQLQTSLNRLFVQIWPSLLLAAFAGLRAPESMATLEAAAPGKARRKARA